jgi:dipeptidyl aminopeptidase/acylaminoacyl peptidase
VNVRRLLVLFVLCVAVVPASSATASYPGAVGRIVFTSDRTASWTSEVYSAAPDGTDVKRLTWNDRFEQSPAWSPDGSRIAYEGSDPGGRSRLYVMNQDGSDQHVVSPTPSSDFDDTQPAWSPDGLRIAFASTRPNGAAWHVWVMNADGTNLHQLPGDLTQDPVWSPDGSRIAGDAGNGPLYVIDADGTNQRRLTSPPSARYDTAPDWSPDGNSLVFAEYTGDGTSSSLRAINADGSGEHQLTGGYSDFGPSWSPDGAAIVFYRRASLSGYFQLYTIGAGGGSATQLLSSYGDDMGPSWGSSTVSPVASPPDAPRIQIYSPRDNGVYFPGTTDPVYYGCFSEVSYVISCEGSQPFGATVDTSFAGVHYLTVTATDVEGRQTTATVSYTVYDITPPTIDLRTPADGGTYDLGANETVDYACSDGVGGSDVLYCGGDVPDGAPLDTSVEGTFTVRVTALDGAYNFTTATATYTVIDRTPPSVTVTTPADQAVYKQDQVVAADYACTGSNLISCSGTVASGAAIDTSTVGDHTLTVTARKAGHNTTTVSRGYTVIYDFSGFSPPVAAFPTVNTWKAGGSVPLKFSLHGNRGVDIFAATSPAWTACDASTAGAPAASGTLSYNVSIDRYTFLAGADKSWTGTCRDLIVTLRDGTAHRARFVFEK